MADEEIEGIAKTLFNQKSKKLGIHSYEQFVEAFEKYSSLKKS
ncbi:hypothetical protein SAMN05216311_114205 [Chitinophaga sp. CF418]|nr:hypothetical protein SAMN05216311_114205 [Chitinophaga sp. CF418]